MQLYVPYFVSTVFPSFVILSAYTCLYLYSAIYKVHRSLFPYFFALCHTHTQTPHYTSTKINKRKTTLIKAKLKKSDDQKNIDKYRVAVNII